MSIAKQNAQKLLNRLPDNSTYEDIQYHLYVLEKIQRGVQRASREGAIPQEQVEKRLNKWLVR